MQARASAGCPNTSSERGRRPRAAARLAAASAAYRAAARAAARGSPRSVARQAAGLAGASGRCSGLARHILPPSPTLLLLRLHGKRPSNFILIVVTAALPLPSCSSPPPVTQLCWQAASCSLSGLIYSSASYRLKGGCGGLPGAVEGWAEEWGWHKGGQALELQKLGGVAGRGVARQSTGHNNVHTRRVQW